MRLKSRQFWASFTGWHKFFKYRLNFVARKVIAHIRTLRDVESLLETDFANLSILCVPWHRQDTRPNFIGFDRFESRESLVMRALRNG